MRRLRVRVAPWHRLLPPGSLQSAIPRPSLIHHPVTCASLSSRSQASGRLVCAGCCSSLRLAGRRLARGGRAIWLRSVRAVPSNTDAFVAALGHLTPQVLAVLAEAASNDGCRLLTSLDTPVQHGEVTTLQLRWWHDRGASVTAALDGELALRPIGIDSPELTITARYRCHERRRFPTQRSYAAWANRS